MAITKISELGDTIPTIIEAAHFTEQFTALMRPLAWNIRKPAGSTANVPYFGEVTARVLAEGVDNISAETMQDTNVQVTLNKVGLKIMLTDEVIDDDQEDLKRAVGVVMGDAFEKKRDQDHLALLDNGTTSLGGAGTTLTLGHIAAARALLNGNPTTSGGPARGRYTVVIHPFTEIDIVDVLTPIVPVVVGAANSSGYQAWSSPMADRAVANYSIGRLFGMPVLTDGNLSIDTGDDAKGGVFGAGTNGSIIYVDGRVATVEPERDASMGAWELNYVGRYGTGNYLNGWTVELYNDAGSPS